MAKRVGVAPERTFGGKVFEFDSQHSRKSDAQYRADKLRRRGHQARIVKSGSWWNVYWRPSWSK